MSDKKDPGKFTVRFNAADPQQRAVIDLLNQQGRYKAQFLANAILHYIHCSETPDVYAKAALNHGPIEDIVKSILAQQQGKLLPESVQETERSADADLQLDRNSSNAGDLLETEDRDAILRTLNAFRPT